LRWRAEPRGARNDEMLTSQESESAALATPVRSAIHPVTGLLIAALVVFSGLGLWWILEQPGEDAQFTQGTSNPANEAAQEPGTPTYGPPPGNPGSPVSSRGVEGAGANTGAASAPGSAGASPGVDATGPGCAQCGVVTALHEIKVEGEASGVGAVGGGVAGGVLGNQVGHGGGRTIMTILGAIGGALTGNAVEKKVRSKKRYELVLRYDSGQERHFLADKPWPYKVGDPVRVVKGRLRPRDS
jgi:outer membrane lipoprotein SlyB